MHRAQQALCTTTAQAAWVCRAEKRAGAEALVLPEALREAPTVAVSVREPEAHPEEVIDVEGEGVWEALLVAVGHTLCEVDLV